MISSRSLLFVAVCASLAVSRAAADAPEALYIFPLGAQRGTTVDVRIGGMHLHDECPLAVDAADGLTAPQTITKTDTIWFEGPIIPQPDSQKAESYPSDYAARFSITADARLGTRWWRVSTSQGITPSQRFVVGELPEIVEHEIDGTVIPVAVTLPVTINGRTFPREDVDEWSFRAVKGQTIRCEVEAARLGSPLDSQLEIIDAAGRRLAVNSDHYGADSLIVFTAPADGEYRVRIFDAAYGGLQTYVYRLTLSDQPHVTSVYPLGGRRGVTTSFELAGVNLRAKSQAIDVPQEAGNDYAVRFKSGSATTNEVLLETSDDVELLEPKTNDDVAAAAPLPDEACVANGRIECSGDIDYWAFDGVKGRGVGFDLHAAMLGSPLDGVLVVVNADGKELATNDDRAGGNVDPRLSFTPPADGRYYVRVADRSPHRGGANFGYRLHVGEPAGASFGLTLPVDAVTIDRGGTARLKLTASRGPGVDGDLTIVIDNLPSGVTFKGEKIGKGKNDTTLTFTAAADAPVTLADCRVRLVTKIGDEEVSRDAVFDVRRGEPPLGAFRVCTAMPTPFEVVGEFEIPYAQRGTYYVRHYNLVRNGFAGPVTVHLAEKQMRHLQGVQGSTITVPAGVDEFDYPVYLPTRLELARTSRTVVTAVGEVTDEQGKPHKVCFTSVKPSEQISLIIGPGPLSVEADVTAVVADAEQPNEVTVTIDRGDGMTGPVRVELLVPPHIRGIAAEPVVVAPGETAGTLRLRFAADAGPLNMPLTVRAEHGEGLQRVVAETPLEVVVDRR
jgi:hypothetical protein